MATFGERFKFLRTEMNLTQDELVEKFNKVYLTSFNKSTISQYENNKRKPEINILENWADFFDVSIDYLLGRTLVRNHIDTVTTHKANPNEILPEEAQEQLNDYIEFLINKYKK
ncbi:helix-turn-helix domain-containing protein [Clostridioides difficile]|uniref:helix-turn-helix domain-containing protein n=1 Tax=Clostridioides difficile TaxID=1496 RepID=UPI000823FA19|nr:helix-turn-helix transcriptional regulator [Clostridioides difficile]MDO0133689.1 helix-turn-helix domain-containing protein [Clostridioides difficile]MDX5649108.1 helix-turn-helix transcriptional regulator [Clostridioides difficile]HBG7258628.1 XRE family transcriptional regulator [Clostridioides difficile]